MKILFIKMSRQEYVVLSLHTSKISELSRQEADDISGPNLLSHNNARLS